MAQFCVVCGSKLFVHEILAGAQVRSWNVENSSFSMDDYEQINRVPAFVANMDVGKEERKVHRMVENSPRWLRMVQMAT